VGAAEPLVASFSAFRGIDLVTPADRLSPGLLPGATNLLCDRGTLRIRGGRSKYNSAAIGGGAAIRGLHRQYLKSGAKQILAVAGTDLYHATAGTFAPAGLTLDPSSDFSFATLGDRTYFCDGNTGLRSWSGTAAQLLTPITKPSAAPALSPTWNTISAAESTTGWTTTDVVNLAISQDTSVAYEGDASLKCTATESSKGAKVYFDAGAGGLDLSGVRHIGMWVRSTRSGSYLQFRIGKTTGMNVAFWLVNIEKAERWQYVSFPIEDLSDADKKGLRYFGIKVLDDDHYFVAHLDQLEYSGGMTGEYEYRITYYDTVTERESEPSESKIVALQSVRRESVLVDWTTAGASGDADKVRIYRRGGYSTAWRLVTEIDDTTLTYLDELQDYLLGVEQNPYRSVPPPCKYLLAWQSRMVYAGNPDYPSRLYLSNFEEPMVVPTLTLLESDAGAGGYFEVGVDDGDILTGLAVLGEELYVFKGHSVHRVAGTNFADFILRPLTVELGCASHRTIETYHGELIWYTGDAVAILSPGAGLQIVSDPVRTRLEATVAADWGKACAVVHDQKYWLFYCDGTVAYNNRGLVLDLRTGGWTEISGWNVRCAMELAAPGDTPDLYLGDAAAGTVWNADTGTTDDSAPISWEAQLPQVDFGDTTRVKQLSQYGLTVKNAMENLLAEAQADEKRQTARYEHSMRDLEAGEGQPAQRLIRQAPNGRLQGRHLSLKIWGTATTEVEIQTAELRARVLR